MMPLKEFQELIEKVKSLTPDEQRQLSELLALLKASTSQSNSRSNENKNKLERKLLEAGLLSEIKPMVIDVESYRNYKPVKVKGKPVSETIIEERR